jgi:Galactose oxidase, central domain
MKRSLCCFVALCVSGLLAACGGGSGSNGGGGSQLATHFSVATPQDATVGTPFSFTVTALDSSNAVAKSYAGMIHFASTDGQAVLPANSTLANGTGTFAATFNTSGSQTITATDTVTPTIKGVSNAIQASIAPPIGTFTPTAGNMDFPRAGHTATLLQDGTVLIVGGENSTGPLATAEIFNPSNGMFTPTSRSMQTARVGHTATLLTDGTVLVTGGNDATGALATAEIFNPATRMFTPTSGNMETARVGHTATLLNDGRVLVAGGGISPEVLFGPVADPGTASAEIFNPTSGQFTPAGNNMSATRIYHTATLLPSGDVLLAGGNIGSALGDLFSPANNMFTATATGGATALHLAAALLQDGSVFLAGGEALGTPCQFTAPWVSSKNALLFNSSDVTFSDTSDMSTARVSHTATRLTGGEVLIAGGATSSAMCDRGIGKSTFGPVASAELFNSAASGTFATTGNMETARAAQTATLLSNGKVLVVGGVDDDGNDLASAELFQ